MQNNFKYSVILWFFFLSLSLSLTTAWYARRRPDPHQFRERSTGAKNISRKRRVEKRIQKNKCGGGFFSLSFLDSSSSSSHYLHNVFPIFLCSNVKWRNSIFVACVHFRAGRQKQSTTFHTANWKKKNHITMNNSKRIWKTKTNSGKIKTASKNKKKKKKKDNKERRETQRSKRYEHANGQPTRNKNPGENIDQGERKKRDWFCVVTLRRNTNSSDQIRSELTASGKQQRSWTVFQRLVRVKFEKVQLCFELNNEIETKPKWSQKAFAQQTKL